MLTWDAEIGITRGILRVTTQTELENFLLFILSAKSLSSHPLMLAVAAVDYSTHLSKELSGSYHHEIGEIQAQTGHAGALTRDTAATVDPQNYGKLGRAVSDLSQCVSSSILHTSSEQRLCAFLSENMGMVKHEGALDTTTSEPLEAMLRERSSQLDHLHDRFKFYQELCRIQNQIVGYSTLHIEQNTHSSQVINLMAQRDMQQNLEVARDSKSIAAASKRDSSAYATPSTLPVPLPLSTDHSPPTA